MSLQKIVDETFKTILSEVTFKPKVTKDPKTANLSGQAKLPGDEEAQQKMESGDIHLEDIVDQINAIRAGHSLKDPEIAVSLEKYVTDLDIAEKTALFAYLKGIVEIVSRQKTPEIAVEPSDPDPAIEMEKQNLKQQEAQPTAKKTSDNVTKANVTVKANRGGGNEDTTPPKQLPIKPVAK